MFLIKLKKNSWRGGHIIPDVQGSKRRVERQPKMGAHEKD